MRQGEKTIPVKYVELTPAEENLILATFDPISAMAATDAAKLEELLHEVTTGDEALQELLTKLGEDAGLFPAEQKELDGLDPFKEFGEDIETDYCCPKCNYKWSGKPK